jgi:hypothetical protein
MRCECCDLPIESCGVVAAQRIGLDLKKADMSIASEMQNGLPSDLWRELSRRFTSRRNPEIDAEIQRSDRNRTYDNTYVYVETI